MDLIVSNTVKKTTLITILGLTIGATFYSCNNTNQNNQKLIETNPKTNINYELTEQKIDEEIIKFEKEKVMGLIQNKENKYDTTYIIFNTLSVFKPNGKFTIYIDLTKDSKFDLLYTGNSRTKEKSTLTKISECNNTIQNYIQQNANKYLRKIINFKTLKNEENKKIEEKKIKEKNKNIYDALN